MKMTKYILFFLVVCVAQLSEASSLRSNRLLATTQYNHISNVISKKCHVSLAKLPVSNTELEFEVEIDDTNDDNEIEYKQIVFCKHYSLTPSREIASITSVQISHFSFTHNLRKYGLFILLGQLLI